MHRVAADSGRRAASAPKDQGESTRLYVYRTMLWLRTHLANSPGCYLNLLLEPTEYLKDLCEGLVEPVCKQLYKKRWSHCL